MKRTLIPALALLFLAALTFAATPLGAQPAGAPSAVPAATSAAPAPLPDFLASLAKGEGSAALEAPLAPPLGAIYVDIDWECVGWCQEAYQECARGCSACDQCSCQFAYCNAGCGIPFQGC